MTKEANITLQQFVNYLSVERDQRHAAIIKKAKIEGTIKEMEWNEFWQIYNKLWNAGQYDALLLHLRMNWNPNWVKLDMRGRLAK